MCQNLVGKPEIDNLLDDGCKLRSYQVEIVMQPLALRGDWNCCTQAGGKDLCVLFARIFESRDTICSSQQPLPKFNIYYSGCGMASVGAALVLCSQAFSSLLRSRSVDLLCFHTKANFGILFLPTCFSSKLFSPLRSINFQISNFCRPISTVTWNFDLTMSLMKPIELRKILIFHSRDIPLVVYPVL